MFLNKHTTFWHLKPNLLHQLIDALENNSGWKRILELKIFNEDHLYQINASVSPAKTLLHQLEIQSISLDTLKRILRFYELFDALAVIAEHEPLIMTHQPTRDLENDQLQISLGEKLHLKCVAVGLPPPNYLWMKENQPVFPEQTNSELTINNFSANDEGDYWCIACQRLTNGATEELHSVHVTVQMLPVPYKVVMHPESIVNVDCGGSFRLICYATGHPAPTYQWYHDGKLLPNQTSSELNVTNATKDHIGKYYCEVSNTLQSSCSLVNVFVRRANLKGKIALLIANKKYTHWPKVKLSISDAEKLTGSLQALGFITFTYFNLTHTEMEYVIQKFSEYVKHDYYVLFYFAGHGFQLGNNYLVPLDCPNEKYLRKDNISEEKIRKLVLDRNPALFIVLPDMCLTSPNKNDNPDIFLEEMPEPHEYISNRNLVVGYPTSPHQMCYELKKEKNGFYVKHLLKLIEGHSNDWSIQAILNKLKTAMNEEKSNYTRIQQPFIVDNTADDSYLTDGVEENCKIHEYFCDLFKPKRETYICKDSRKLTLCMQRYKNCNNTMSIEVCGNLQDIFYEIKDIKDPIILKKIDNNTICLIVSDLQKMDRKISLVFDNGEHKILTVELDNIFYISLNSQRNF